MDGHDLKLALGQFTGSDQVFRHALVKSFLYSEGVQFFLQNAGGGAYWFSDIIATQPEIREACAREGFLVVSLKVVNHVGHLVVAADTTSDGEGFEGIAYARTIDFTDCPEGQWKFYLEPNTFQARQVMVMCLPAER